MKKYYLILFLLLFVSTEILACNITILPSSGQYNVGDEVSLKIERVQTCGRCVLPLDQTKFNIENAKIIDIGNWTKEGFKDVIYVKIKFTEVGQVKFEVIRACSKNYNVARANFTVNEKIAQSSIKEENPTSSANLAISNSSNISSNTSYNTSSNISSNSNSISIPTNIQTTNSTNTNNATNIPTTSSNHVNIKESANTNNATNVSVNVSADENMSNNSNESTNNIGEEGNPAKNLEQINEQSLEQTPTDSNNFIAYILIAFFLIAGLVSYLLKLKFMRNILLLFSLIFLGFYLGGCPCIVGTTFNIFNIKNANLIYLVLLSFIPIATSFIWGRWFCGWFCPVGAFQKFLYSIKIKNPKNIFYKINYFFKKNDKILRYIKLVIFAIFGYLYISKGYNLFCHYEPFKAIFAFNGSLLNVTIAFVVFLLASINHRFFCKYLCPLGGILKITSRFALKKIRINSDCCTGCKICTKDICPMDALKCDEKNNKIDLDHSECIRCLKCVDACKVKAYNV